jgi:8-oxo-dGTP pyrophosphatase MutT (NUDIX family)
MDLEQAETSGDRSRPVVAVAILHQDGKFLMQLRDDDPRIMYPGHWAFFGGHLEPGESPETGVRRELLEEINYCPEELTLFHIWTDGQVTRHVYHGILGAKLGDLILTEGLDMQLLNLEDIQRGDRYSPKIQQVRPLGPPHQQILLDFVKSREEWVSG